jgi:predicted RNase H-like HicB family nuclease
MGRFNLQHTALSKEKLLATEESLKMSSDVVEGFLKTFTGQQGEFYVSIVPALNVSGYGKDEAEALESLEENLNTFFDDLFELSEVDRHKEVMKLGWVRDRFFKKRFSSSFIDENGVLQNFDFPEKVTKSILQAA